MSTWLTESRSVFWAMGLSVTWEVPLAAASRALTTFFVLWVLRLGEIAWVCLQWLIRPSASTFEKPRLWCWIDLLAQSFFWCLRTGSESLEDFRVAEPTVIEFPFTVSRSCGVLPVIILSDATL